MAAPTTMIGLKAATINTSTDEATLTLDPQCQYLIKHLAIDVGGNPQTERIDFGVEGTSAGLAANPNVFSLDSADILEIGPGIGTLKFKAAANDPAFSIIEQEYFRIIN